MSTALSTSDFTKFELAVSSRLLPGEETLRIFKQSPRAAIVNAMKLYAVVIVLASVLGPPYAIATGRVTSWGVHEWFCLGMAFVCGFLLMAFLVVRALSTTAMAITSKRLIMLSVPDGKLRAWTSFDDLNAVEVKNGTKECGDLILRFATPPKQVFGEGPPRFGPRKFTLIGVPCPEELKLSLGQQISADKKLLS